MLYLQPVLAEVYLPCYCWCY